MLPLLTALGLGDEDRLRARFSRGFKPRCSKIACISKEDLGWIQVSSTKRRFHLDQLHLHAQWRGQGIGTFLLTSLTARATQTRRTVALDVIRGNPAIGLYRRMGFQIVGEDEEKFQMLWRPDRPVKTGPA
ncbi:GNAT family N-acetyltransferase [Lichenifustis flavocetrariae]|uniref:GNAT family N-acetyltransferase n=1 Tax=Lichenifustis flavocetrariae TaxID=2949735 RepID=A0AA42CGP3_9HYPH|nr:N-acetyltransferase [Lichenifustis flavocetrariae]MCW6506783.1 GNAT family N-acetyltransferase [Lichenifustis flavocetrariae]